MKKFNLLFLRKLFQLFLLFCLSFLPVHLYSQVTEHFSDEVPLATTQFTNSGYTFDFTAASFQILTGSSYGWTGIGFDDYMVDNDLNLPATAGVLGSLTIATGNFAAHNLWVFPGETSAAAASTGDVIFRGKLGGIVQYTYTLLGAAINTGGTNGGWTLVDLSAYNAVAIDELEFEVTGSLRYLGMDALSFNLLPDAPTAVSAVAGIAQADVSFTAPAFDGGTPITGYTVTSSPESHTGTGLSSPINVAGLTNGTAYTFTVTAENIVGSSLASSASVAVTPLDVPGAPTAVSAVEGNTEAIVTFTAPVSDGGSAITGYTVTSNPEGLTATGAASPLTVIGLTNGTAYTFTVTATNAKGTSVASAASAAVTPATVPDAPTAVSAVEGNAQADVSFTAPVSNGGSAITSYTVTSNPGSFTATGAASPLTVTGLANGTAYTFTVTATNAKGTSIASAASAAVTPTSIPGAPTAVSAVAGNTTAEVSFTAPASDGGSAITSYTVTSDPEGLTATGAASPLTVTGLTNGTAYTFTVTATNVNGTSIASAASAAVTPATVPDAPTAVSAVEGNTEAIVTFTVPASDGGSAITGYTVTSDPEGLTATGAASPLTVTGLTNGIAYTFTVTATNAKGTSIASAASSAVTPATVPDAPTAVSAVEGNTEAIVTFIAPVSNGGSAITGYTVTSDPEGLTATGAASPLTVTGMTNGTAYTFTVTATNAKGTSIASAASAAVTPATVPDAPTAASGVAGNAQVIVSFTAPVSNGGSAITAYTVTSNPGGLTATGAASPLTVTGLTNGTAYTFTVTATNAKGTSIASAASAAVTPAFLLPGAPTGVSAIGGNAYAYVYFTAPMLDGGSPILSYTVTSIPDGVTATGTASPILVTGLTNGKYYTFTVAATNVSGTGTASAPSSPIQLFTSPSSPLNVTAIAGNAEATVSFDPPVSSGGVAIALYTVISSPGGFKMTGSESPITVPGLANGTPYTFIVEVSNSKGYTTASAPSAAVTPQTVPDAPINLIVTIGDKTASIAFETPTSDGGASITGYTITSEPGGFTASGVSSPIDITGLTNGIPYTFTATATNSVGTSLPSVASDPAVYFATTSDWTGTGNWEDFVNWSNGIPGNVTTAKIDGNVTLNSDGTVKNLTILENSSLVVKLGAKLTLIDPIQNFGMINNEGEIIGEIIVPIVFEENGGDNLDDMVSTYNSVLNLPTPVRAGYTFVQWCTDSELTIPYVATLTPINGIVLYAKWEFNVGIKMLNRDLLTVYPNPTTDGFVVNAAVQSSQLNVFDISGRLVLTKLVSSKSYVDIQSLKPGVYLIRMNDQMCKLIKR